MKRTELPKQCDNCGKDHSSILPPLQFQRKAIWLIAAGILATFPWALLIFLSMTLLLPRGGIIIPVGGPAVIIWLPILLLLVAPGYLVGLYAYTFPKMVRRQCYYCKTTREYVITERG